MSLEQLFNPQSVAIIGATQDTRRPGGAPLHLLTHQGYAGKVFAVNPLIDARKIRALLVRAKRPYLTWDEVLGRLGYLRYVTPRDLVALRRSLEQEAKVRVGSDATERILEVALA